MRKTGFIPVVRSSANSRKQVIDMAVNKIRNNVSVHFFPEGTRTDDGIIGPFRLGAFRVAQNSGVRVVPLMIYGSRDVLRKHDFQIYPGIITMHILPTVEISSDKDSDLAMFAENVRKSIHTHFEREKMKRNQGLC
jgi:1-acyl-sn-glycerol-3-phosphate acyltransferase